MASGRAYRIKKSEVKGYGYTKPKSRANPRRLTPNASVTHIAAINGRGAYSSARRTMSGLSSSASRRNAARSSLSVAKKKAFAKRMRSLKKNSSRNSSSSSLIARNPLRVQRSLPGYRVSKLRANRSVPSVARPTGSKKTIRRRVKPARRGTTTQSARSETRKKIMARKVRRTRKKSAARAPVARRTKRRVKRRKVAKKVSAAPVRRVKRRRKKARAKKTTLKANRRRSRRRLKRNYGTRVGALKGWRTRRSRKRAAGSTKKRRKSRKVASAAPKRSRRRSTKRKLKANRRRRTLRRNRRSAALAPNRRRRRSHRRNRRSAALSPNRRRRSRRRLSSNRRRRSHRRNGRSMFRKNGILEPIVFIAKTGGLALAGLVTHKLITNVVTQQIFNRIFGSPAAVVATPSATLVTAPATSGLGGLAIDPSYQKLGASLLVAGLGCFATAKVVKDPTTRNTVMTGIALSFMHTLFTVVLGKFAPQYSDMLSGEDGTAARLSAMYGLGNGASIQPRYTPIGMGEYFQGTAGLGLPSYEAAAGMGEYFQGTAGLGEYFQGTAGLGSYGGNPDLMEAAAGMGARETMSTNHIDPHGDLDRELTIAEAAAGVGSLPSYEAAAGFGAVSSLPSASTWIPGTTDGQIWAGTRAISNPQSATEMVPAGILQTDGGQGVFG